MERSGGKAGETRKRGTMNALGMDAWGVENGGYEQDPAEDLEPGREETLGHVLQFEESP